MTNESQKNNTPDQRVVSWGRALIVAGVVNNGHPAKDRVVVVLTVVGTFVLRALAKPLR